MLSIRLGCFILLKLKFILNFSSFQSNVSKVVTPLCVSKKTVRYKSEKYSAKNAHFLISPRGIKLNTHRHTANYVHWG